MNLARKVLTGTLLAGTLFASSCKGTLDVNVGEQNRGTVSGQVVWQSHNADGTINTNPVYSPHVRLTNQDNSLFDTPYRTIRTNDGQFLIEVPAGVMMFMYVALIVPGTA